MLNPTPLILVSGHALFKDETPAGQPLEAYKNDGSWVLLPYQNREIPYYIQHIEAGLTILKSNPAALLIFSGGRTRAGAKVWSEARSYLEVAKSLKEWSPDLEKRVLLEEFARDSFQNLLYSYCKFYLTQSHWPGEIQIINFQFKQERFEFYRDLLNLSREQFSFTGINTIESERIKSSQLKIMADLKQDPYGLNPENLGRKRVDRNPHSDENPYRQIDSVRPFLEFLENPENVGKKFEGEFPWS